MLKCLQKASENRVLSSVRLQRCEGGVAVVKIHAGVFCLILVCLLQGQRCGFFRAGGLKRV